MSKPKFEAYPDEPDPRNEFEWKAFWVKKMFDPNTPMTEGMRLMIHEHWKETSANRRLVARWK